MTALQELYDALVALPSGSRVTIDLDTYVRTTEETWLKLRTGEVLEQLPQPEDEEDVQVQVVMATDERTGGTP